MVGKICERGIASAFYCHGSGSEYQPRGSGSALHMAGKVTIGLA